MDDNYMILDENWAIIYTDQYKWELEDRKDFSHFKLRAKSQLGAIKAGRALAKKKSSFMDAVNTPSSEDTHIYNLYKVETK